MSEEVWITGVGAVTAAGGDRLALARLLADGGTAVIPLEALGGRMGGRATAAPRDRAMRRLDRSAQLFRAACAEAWRGAGLASLCRPRRVAVLEGSSLGPLAGVLEDHAELLADPRERNRPSRLSRFMTGAGGALFAQEVGILGPVLHFSAGSVSAACAVGEAFQRLAAGALDLAVAGGSECPLHPEIVGTFGAAGVLSPIEVPCRPFDRRRDGTVLGEGAAAFLLETGRHARARGAVPLARISGYGFCTEAYDLTRPDPDGRGVAAAAMDALRMAAPRRVAWIKAHGTGTRANDAAELRALVTVFGAGLAGLPVVSLKSTLGHCLGASGAVELAATVEALTQGFVPATHGFEESDPELPCCRVRDAVQDAAGDSVLLLAESFGGRCAGLVIDRA